MRAPSSDIQGQRSGLDRITLVALAVLVGGLTAEMIRPSLRPRQGPTTADRLAVLPARGARRGSLLWWGAVLKAAILAFNRDRIPAVAAGVSFYGILALFPALAAFVSFAGLFGRATDGQKALAMLAGLAPPETLRFLADEMVRIAATHHAQLGVTFAVSAMVSIWSANAAMTALLGGLNIAYEQPERRGFIRLNLVSLSFTISAIGLAVIGSVLIAVTPDDARLVGLGWIHPEALLRWPALLIAVIAVLGVLYQYGPSRPRAWLRWVTAGSVVAAVSWLIISLVFTVYVSTFGHYDRMYGPLGALVGFMIWLWITVSVVLFGAELNSEIERALLPLEPA